MTETTNEIFEKYEVRKTKKQKSAFIDYIFSIAQSRGYNVKVEEGKCKSRNIVIGNPYSAKVTFTAHYDTCAVLPFPNFITPKSIFIYIMYQIFLTAVILIVPICAGIAASFILPLCVTDESIADSIVFVFTYAMIFLSLYLLVAGPANKHTANDNTSGVTTLVDIMVSIPESEKEKAAFVFFDNEELGLVGSASFKKKHGMKYNLIINFDCVSDGKNFIFSFRRGAKKYLDRISAAYSGDENIHPEFLLRGAFCPSDQMHFPAGVGVQAFKKTKKLGILYLNRIHTKRDTVYDTENIQYLVDGSIKLISSFN